MPGSQKEKSQVDPQAHPLLPVVLHPPLPVIAQALQNRRVQLLAKEPKIRTRVKLLKRSLRFFKRLSFRRKRRPLLQKQISPLLKPRFLLLKKYQSRWHQPNPQAKLNLKAKNPNPSSKEASQGCQLFMAPNNTANVAFIPFQLKMASI